MIHLFKNHRRRNLLNAVIIALLLAVIISHFVDVASHTEYRAQIHQRIFAVAIILNAVKALSVLRYTFEKLGVLVIVLSASIERIFIWFCLFIIFWIPFSNMTNMLSFCQPVTLINLVVLFYKSNYILDALRRTEISIL